MMKKFTNNTQTAHTVNLRHEKTG